MSHFSLKSLAFYGIAISSVVVLFRVVSTYGEANLKAPPLVGERYRINAQNLPGCLKSDALLLKVKQSGIYLSGSLLPADSNAQLETIAEEKPSLSGQLSHPQLSLSGSLPWITSCNQAGESGGANSVRIQGVVEGETLAGQLMLNSTPVQFTAQREAVIEQPGMEH